MLKNTQNVLIFCKENYIMKEVKTIETIKNEYTLKNDVIFKEFFSRKSNEKFLINFLSVLLDMNITQIEVQKDSSLGIENVRDKQGILDIKATINNEKIIDIEMQLERYKNIPKRMSFYASRLISTQLESGEDYLNIKPVIIILLLNYDMFEYEDYITETVTVSKAHRQIEIDQNQKYIIIELKKLREKNEEMANSLIDWLIFIDGEKKEKIKEIMERNSIIKNAAKELDRLNLDEEAKIRAEARDKALRDEVSFLAEAKRSGLEEGMQKGIQESRKEIIKKMYNENIDIKLICNITNSTEEEILKIIHQ